MIDTIILSHLYLDRVCDLAALLNVRPLYRRKLAQCLQIFGPPGLRRHGAWLARRMDPWFSDYRPDLVEIVARTYRTNGLRIEAGPTGHASTSMNYLVTDAADQRLFYS